MLTGLQGGDVSKLPISLISRGAYLREIQIGSVRQLINRSSSMAGVPSSLTAHASRFNEMVKQIEVCGIKPVIGKVFEFDQGKEAFEHLQSQNFVGKVVILGVARS